MNRFRRQSRFSFVSFCNLFMQDFHGRCGNLVNLLSDSTDRNNSFSGNWRIIKTNDLVVIWKLSILLNQMIEHDVGKCIVWKKNSLCFALIFRINCFQQIFENQRTFFITVAGICENQFMWNLIFLADIRKAFYTAIGWNLWRSFNIDVDQNICSGLCKETGCLHRSHIVIRIDTAHKLIFTLDRYNWEIVGGELSGRNGMA